MASEDVEEKLTEPMPMSKSNNTIHSQQTTGRIIRKKSADTPKVVKQNPMMDNNDKDDNDDNNNSNYRNIDNAIHLKNVGVSYQAPLNDANMSSASSRNRPHGRSRSTPKHESNSSAAGMSSYSSQGPSQRHPEVSFQERITASALSGTMDVLKLIGDMTLSTTGKIVAPPIHVTRTILLPTIWAAFRDYLDHASPQRLKDWYRIVSSSIYHIIHTLGHTDAGQVVQSRCWILLADIIDCLSSETTRQVLIDHMTCLVKWTDVLHTPEVHDWLEQCAVLFSRCVDMAADGRIKLIGHDAAQMAWAICQLLADPETVTAWAEITAYLCYALEMEQQQQLQQQKRGLIPKYANTQRRRERNNYQSALSNDTLQSNPDLTVEEAILSSLGLNLDTTWNQDNVPNNIVCDDVPTQHSSEQGTAQSAQQKESENHHNHHNHCSQNSDDDEDSMISAPKQQWHERVREGVDVSFLREGIEQRAMQIQRQRDERDTARLNTNQTVDDVEDLPLAVTTVFQDDDDDENDDDIRVETINDARPQSCRAKTILRTSPSSQMESDRKIAFRDEIDPWYQHQNPIVTEGESSCDHFHRILDEILQHKRKGAVLTAIKELQENNDCSFLTGGMVHRPLRNRGDKNLSVKDRLMELRATLSAEQRRTEPLKRDISVHRKPGKSGKSVAYFVCFVGLVILWGAFGCYGVYKFLQPTNATTGRFARESQSVRVNNNQEILIRVVHVDGTGKEIEDGLWNRGSETTLEDHKKVAECATNVYS